jgi:predicted nucleic acid-binding protein
LVLAFLDTLPVLGLNLPASERFGQLKSELETTGRRIADADLFIASITLAYGATLVTGNSRHYARIPGLPLEDWIRS